MPLVRPNNGANIMSLVLLVSIVLQSFALGWSLVLLKHLRDGRLSVLTAMLGLMLVRPGTAFFQSATGSAGNQLADLPDLAVSVLAAVSVVLVGRMFPDRASVGENFAAIAESTQAEYASEWDSSDTFQLRKNAVTALLRERSFAQSLINNAPVVILLLDLEGHIQYINPFLEQLTGYRLDEVKDRAWFTTFLPERDRDRMLALFKTAIHGVPTRGNVNPIVTRAGEQREIEWYDQVMRDENGAINGVLAIGLDVTERCLVEKRLRESRERFELAVRGATDGVWDANLVTSETYVSDRWCELVGYQRDGMPDAASLWQWVFAQIHPDDVASVDDAVRRHWELRQPYGVDFRMRTKNGEYRWFYSRGQAAWNPQGKAVRFAGCLTDVTERRRAEEELRQTRDRLEAMLQALPDLLFEVDQSGRIFDYRAQQPHLLAVPPEHFLGKTFAEVLPPDAVEACHRAIREAADKGVGLGNPYRLALADGTHWFEMSVARKASASGKDATFIALARDITERISAETERRMNEERLQVGLATVDIAVFSQDLDLRYTWMFQPQLGYTTEKVVGRTDAELLPPEAARQVMAIKRQVIQRGESVRAEVQMNRDGRTLAFDLIAKPLCGADGTIVGLTGATLDLTERKRKEEELRASQERLESLSRQLIMAQETERQNLATRTARRGAHQPTTGLERIPNKGNR
jgi:PAS domain S-box-containing protein